MGPVRQSGMRGLLELSNATIVPQGDVVADITRGEDELSLMPRNAVGTATLIGSPECYWSTRKTEEG